jgi:hypothetical protein
MKSRALGESLGPNVVSWIVSVLGLAVIACGGRRSNVAISPPPAAPQRTPQDSITPEPADINGYVASILKLPKVAYPPDLKSSDNPSESVVNRRRHSCATNHYQEGSSFGEIVALDPNLPTLWPGAVVQGTSLKSGRLKEIPLQRAAGVYVVKNLTKVGQGKQLFVRKVKHPDLGESEAAIQALTGDPKTIAPATAANMDLRISEVYSLEQSLLDVGVSAEWTTGNFAAELTKVASSKKHALMVNFVQSYYSIVFPYPRSAAAFFGNRVHVADLQRFAWQSDPARTVNPPAYISSVTYGRMLLMSISSDEEVSTLRAAVNAAFSSVSASGKMNLDTQQAKVLQQSSMSAIAIGGGARAAAKIIANLTSGTLQQYLEEGADYDPQRSPGAPISYAVRYLADDDVADVSYTADYSLEGCSDSPLPIQKVTIVFRTGDDDKDPADAVRVTLLRGAEVLAEGGPWGGHQTWNDHTTSPGFDLAVKPTFDMDKCNGAVVRVSKSADDGSDSEWHVTFELSYVVAGKSYVVRGRSGDENEFKLGDNKPDDTGWQGASCPF